MVLVSYYCFKVFGLGKADGVLGELERVGVSRRVLGFG